MDGGPCFCLLSPEICAHACMTRILSCPPAFLTFCLPACLLDIPTTTNITTTATTVMTNELSCTNTSCCAEEAPCSPDCQQGEGHRGGDGGREGGREGRREGGREGGRERLTHSGCVPEWEQTEENRHAYETTHIMR